MRRVLVVLLAFLMVCSTAAADFEKMEGGYVATSETIECMIPFKQGFLIAYSRHLEYFDPNTGLSIQLELEDNQGIWHMAYDAQSQIAHVIFCRDYEGIYEQRTLDLKNDVLSWTKTGMYGQIMSEMLAIEGVWVNNDVMVQRIYDYDWLKEGKTQGTDWNENRFHVDDLKSDMAAAFAVPGYQSVEVLGLDAEGNIVEAVYDESEKNWFMQKIDMNGVPHTKRILVHFQSVWSTYDAATDEVVYLKKQEDGSQRVVRLLPDGSELKCGEFWLGYEYLGKRGFCVNGNWVAAASMLEVVFQQRDVANE